MIHKETITHIISSTRRPDRSYIHTYDQYDTDNAQFHRVYANEDGRKYITTQCDECESIVHDMGLSARSYYRDDCTAVAGIPVDSLAGAENEIEWIESMHLSINHPDVLEAIAEELEAQAQTAS